MKGRVTLLGAGPGDPELLTLIGKRRLKEADVVLYDRLIDPSLLAFTNDRVELVNVGKLPQYHRVTQTQINQMLVHYARADKKVVRLKAGDPYVFGRGGEEAQELQKAGIDFEVIPGITSAIAGPAAVGIPITHRYYASSFHVITGHHKKNGRHIDWENVAHQEGTLVFLMGMAQLPKICQHLISNGKDPHTPVAVIQWATQWRQRMVKGDLTNIHGLVVKHQIGAPALIVVGMVVQLAKQLGIKKPLQGVHLLLTNNQHSRLSNQLVDQGATVDFYLCNKKVATKADLTALGQYSNILFTSGAAFKFFISQLIANGYDLRCLSRKHVWVLNQIIAHHLKQWGIIADGIVTDKIPVNCIEVGGAQPQTNADAFISVYQYQKSHFTLPFDFAEFNAVLFPNNVSLHDFTSTLTEVQLQQLKNLKAFTMGSTIAANADKLGFDKVIDCPPQIAAIVRVIKREFNDKKKQSL